MKVLLINGSPNEAGCTFTALSEAARILEEEGIETEMFQLGKKPIRGCCRLIYKAFSSRIKHPVEQRDQSAVGRCKIYRRPYDVAVRAFRLLDRPIYRVIIKNAAPFVDTSSAADAPPDRFFPKLEHFRLYSFLEGGRRGRLHHRVAGIFCIGQRRFNRAARPDVLCGWKMLCI